MALGSTAVFPRLFPSTPLCSSFKNFIFFSAPFLPPSSPQPHSRLVILSRPSSALSSTSSSSALSVASTSPHHIYQSDDVGSAFSVNLGTEVVDGLGEGEGEERAEPLTKQRQLSKPVTASLPSFPSPKLTIKEKKELASYAQSLGKKLKSQQIGKFGVTPTVASAMVESLEANELLKLKVHGSCPGELSEVIKQLENATGSTSISQIGRTLILYRPSLAKMKKKDADRTRMQQQQKNPIKSVTSFNVQKKFRATRTFS